MGQAVSCSSPGALLLTAAANNDITGAQRIIQKHPRATVYCSYKDHSSPLLHAAAKGHLEMVQLILESAVMGEGLSRAKRLCLDHVNIKRQTALMVACKHGHPECVEYLVSNGADPVIADERRNNTCLHLAALYGHSDCVHRLLGARSAHCVSGRQLLVSQVPCEDAATGSQIKFVDIRNGWGLTALHIAVFQGALNTARTLLRHGAALDAVISPPAVEHSPIRCAIGSNVLHIAAMVGSIGIVKLILEAQEAFPGMELRAVADCTGLKPQHYAQRARNPVLAHLLDERLPVHLLRQVWLNYSMEAGLPSRHHTLGSLLQKLKLMFNLEVIAAQHSISVADGMLAGAAVGPSPRSASISVGEDLPPPARAAESDGGGETAAGPRSAPGSAAAAPLTAAMGLSGRSSRAGRGGAAPGSPPLTPTQVQQVVSIRAAWQQRQQEVQALLATVTVLHDNLVKLQANRPDALLPAQAQAALSGPRPALSALVLNPAPAPDGGAGQGTENEDEPSADITIVTAVGPAAAPAGQADQAVPGPRPPSPRQPGPLPPAPDALTMPRAASAPCDAVLDFILSMLITPRTVSAVLHAAKKLVTGSSAMGAGASDSGRTTRDRDPPLMVVAGQLAAPKTSSEAQHSMGLLLTALRAVETCLAAAAQLAKASPEDLQNPSFFLGATHPLPPAAIQGAVASAIASSPAASTAPGANAAGGNEGALDIPRRPATPAALVDPPSFAFLPPLPAAPGPPSAPADPGAGHTGNRGLAVGDHLPDGPHMDADLSHGVGAPAGGPGTVERSGVSQTSLAAGSTRGGTMGLGPGQDASTHSTLNIIALAPPLPPTPSTITAPTLTATLTAGTLTTSAIPPPAGLSSAHWGAHLHALLAQLQWDIGVQRHRRRRQHAAAAAARAAAVSSRRLSGTSTATAPAAPHPPDDTPSQAGATAGTGDAASTMAVWSGRSVDHARDHTDGLAAGERPLLPPGLGGGASAGLSAAASLAADAGTVAGSSHVGGGDSDAESEATRVGSAAATGLPRRLHAVLSRRGDAPQDVLTAPGGAVATPAPSTLPDTPRTSMGAAAPAVSELEALEPIEAGHVEGEVEALAAVAAAGGGPDDRIGTTMGIMIHSAAGAGTMCSGGGGGGGAPTARLSLTSGGALSGLKPDGGKAGSAAGGPADGADWPGDGLGAESDTGDESVSGASDPGVCAICMENPMAVVVSPCQHGLCVHCALQLTVKGRDAPTCPFCRCGIAAFQHRTSSGSGVAVPRR